MLSFKNLNEIKYTCLNIEIEVPSLSNHSETIKSRVNG